MHFSFQWLCYQNMSYDFVERKEHVSDMATSIQAEKVNMVNKKVKKLIWVEVNIFSHSFLQLLSHCLF